MEEDIKILEERIDYFKCHPEGCNWKLSFEDEKDIQAIENLIKGYREQEEKYINPSKARISYYDTKKRVKVVIEGFIPKSKIKEKIEEIIKSNPKQSEDWDGTDYEVTPEENYAIEILEELMEDK